MTARVHMRWVVAALVALAMACNVGVSGAGTPPPSDIPGKKTTSAGDDPLGNGPLAGGQSGTDGKGGEACPSSTQRSVAFDEVTPAGSAADVRRRFEKRLSIEAEIPLRWAPEFGGTTTLAIEVVEWGAQATFHDDERHVCQWLSVPATLHLTTADGLLDDTIEGTFALDHWNGGYGDAAAVQRSTIGEHLAMTFDQPGLTLDTFGVSIDLSQVAGLSGAMSATTALEDDAVVSALYNLAKFDSTWTRDVALGEPYRRPHAFDGICEAAQDSPPPISQFASDDGLVEALTGDWVLCNGESTSIAAHAGIAIAADGTWTHLSESDGTLVEKLGFEHEGTFEVIDTSDSNGPNSRQLNIGPFAQEYGFSSDRRTLHLVAGNASPSGPSYDYTYVRTDLSIGPPRLERDRNERAGAAACEEGEAFVHGFASVDDLRKALVGSWAICSGGFRDGALAIAFATEGTYRHLDADGKAIAAGRYELSDATQVSMTDDDAPFDRSERVYGMDFPLMSDAPIKLLSRSDETVTVLSALP